MKTILYTVGLILPIVGPVAAGQVKTSGATEGYAAVNGTKLYYEIRGQGHPLVLIHGGFMDRRMWDGQFDFFAQKYKVIRYDIRGYEKSDKAAGSYSHIEDLRRLLDFLGVAKPHLLGLSLGGQIAVDFTLEHPDRVDSLILVGAAVTGYPFKYTADFLAKYAAVLKAAKTADLEKAVAKVLELPFFIPAKPDSELVNRMQPMLRENLRAWTSAEGRAAWPDPPAFQRIEKIAAATLIIVGDKDIQNILDVGEMLKTRIKGARKAVVHDAAHHVNMEQPEKFNRLVLDFLAGL